MNHRRAAQLSSGGWHMVTGNRRTGTHPTGYCDQHPGHATETEARECFAQYQRERVRLDGTCSWTDCQAVGGCPNPANQHARIEGDGYSMLPLCPTHLTEDEAIKGLHIDGPAGDAWYM